MGMRSRVFRDHPRGFTLVELLVVIGIIAVLVGILLPVLANARKSAMDMQCQSNIRQLCSAMIMYANEFKGRYPPNIGTSGAGVHWWYDAERLGRYLPKTKQFGTTSVFGTVFICPRDEEAGRSYAMNYYASSGPITPAFNTMDWAQYFTAGSKPASELMLITEKWSVFGPQGSYAAGNVVGLSGINITTPGAPPFSTPKTPGGRWAGNLSVNTGGRFGTTPTELDYTRHRKRGEGRTYLDADGRINIGFADGHVAMFRTKELGDASTSKSKFAALWSPMDKAWQQKYLP